MSSTRRTDTPAKYISIIERYRRRESSVEEALIEMYLAGVSVRRVEDITEALWGTRVSPSTVSDLNKKIYGTIFLEAAWQRCVVHWYRNIFSHVPSTKVREIAAMLKAIHAARTSRQRARRPSE